MIEINKGNYWLESLQSNIAIYGAYIYSFFIFIGHAGSALGLMLMALALIVHRHSNLYVFLRDPLVWLVSVFILVLFGNAYYISANLDFIIDEQLEGAIEWGRYVFLPLLAFAIKGNTTVIKRCLYLILAGFVLSILIGTDYAEYQRVFSGSRTGLSVSIIQMGLWSSIFFVIMLTLTPVILKNCRNSDWRMFIIVAWFILTALMLQILISTQARGAWFATVVALVFIALSYIQSNRIKKNGLLVIAGVVVLVVAMNFHVIYSRMTVETDQITKIASMSDVSDIVISGSVGYRYHMINFSLKRWFEKPLLGWGPGTHITQHFDINDFDNLLDKEQIQILSQFKRLHNGYATVLSQLGIVGLLFFIILFYMAISAIVTAYRKGKVEYDLLTVYLSFFILQLALYLTNSRFTMIEYQLLMGFFVASAYSYRLEPGKDCSSLRKESTHTDGCISQ